MWCEGWQCKKHTYMHAGPTIPASRMAMVSPSARCISLRMHVPCGTYKAVKLRHPATHLTLHKANCMQPVASHLTDGANGSGLHCICLTGPMHIAIISATHTCTQPAMHICICLRVTAVACVHFITFLYVATSSPKLSSTTWLLYLPSKGEREARRQRCHTQNHTAT